MKVEESKIYYRLYSVWSGMRRRCLDEGDKGYKDYGGRGIRIIDEWLKFNTFYEWAIRNNYELGLTIERKDVNGNYCPENCCWIPRAEQAKNRTDNHRITIDGETKLMCEWAEAYGISMQTLSNRINVYGWDEVKAVTTPVKRTKRNQDLGYDYLYKEYVELGKRVKDIEAETGVPKSTIHREIQRLGIHRPS